MAPNVVMARIMEHIVPIRLREVAE